MKFTSELMKRVHEIAKELEGDYVARLSLAFREVLKNEELQGSEKQIAWAKDIKAKSNLTEALAKASFCLEFAKNIDKDVAVLISEIEKIMNKYVKLMTLTSAKEIIERREEFNVNFFEDVDATKAPKRRSTMNKAAQAMLND